MTRPAPVTVVDALARLPNAGDRGFRFRALDGTEHAYPWAALRAEAERRARLLLGLGLRKGDRLAVVLAEPHELVLSILGAAMAGVVAVPIYPRPVVDEVLQAGAKLDRIVVLEEWLAQRTPDLTLPRVEPSDLCFLSVANDGDEQLIIAAEGNSGDAAELRRTIAARVAEACGVQPGHVAVVRVGSLPKTSSGKVQRRKTKQLYERGELEEHAQQS